MNETVRSVLLDLEERYGDHYYQDAARIIRELEAERDRLSGELGKANKWNADHYEETIKLRRRWQWERRRAERAGSMLRIMSELATRRWNLWQEALAERDALRSEYDSACQLVARMHEAATGVKGGGPVLGVVEDVAALRARCERMRIELENIAYATPMEWTDWFPQDRCCAFVDWAQSRALAALKEASDGR